MENHTRYRVVLVLYHVQSSPTTVQILGTTEFPSISLQDLYRREQQQRLFFSFFGQSKSWPGLHLKSRYINDVGQDKVLPKPCHCDQIADRSATIRANFLKEIDMSKSFRQFQMEIAIFFKKFRILGEKGVTKIREMLVLVKALVYP